MKTGATSRKKDATNNTSGAVFTPPDSRSACILTPLRDIDTLSRFSPPSPSPSPAPTCSSCPSSEMRLRLSSVGLHGQFPASGLQVRSRAGIINELRGGFPGFCRSLAASVAGRRPRSGGGGEFLGAGRPPAPFSRSSSHWFSLASAASQTRPAAFEPGFDATLLTRPAFWTQ